MAVEDNLKRLEERLTRLEATLAQQPGAAGGGGGGFTPPGGAVVDPAPWAGGGGWVFHPRPMPVVDPAPWWGRPRWPTPVVDPAPWPTPVVDPAPWPTPVVDPAPWGGLHQFRQPVATTLGRIGHMGDPAPVDVSRMTVSQLESSLHMINAEKARLTSMETMVNQQLEKMKQQQG